MAFAALEKPVDLSTALQPKPPASGAFDPASAKLTGAAKPAAPAAGGFDPSTATLSGPSATDKRPTGFAGEALGFGEGVINVWDRGALALNMAADQIPFVGSTMEALNRGLGMESAQQVQAEHEAAFKRAEQTTRPGEIGRFAGEVVATIPVAMATDNPWLIGGITGGLTGHGKNFMDVSADIITGMIGQKVLHEGLGFAGSRLSPYLRSNSGRALDYVARLMKSAGRTTEDIRKFAADTLGKPFLGAEAIGRTGRTALTTLGRREGATADRLEGELSARQQEANGRMLDDVEDITKISPKVAQGDLDELVRTGREEAEPLRELAFGVPPQLTPQMETLLADPVAGPIVQQGMKHGIMIEALEHAARKMDDPSAPDFDPNAYGVVSWKTVGSPRESPVMPRAVVHDPQAGTFSAVGSRAAERGSMDVTHIEPVIGKMPTWRTWDAAKRGIDHILEGYRDKTSGRLVLDNYGKAILSIRTSMLKHLDEINPAYGQYRARAGDFMEAKEAFDRGARALFNPRLNERTFTQMLTKMSETAKRSLRGGVANQFLDMAERGVLKPSVLKSDRIKAKLAMTFGAEQANRLIQRMEQEAELRAGLRMSPDFGSHTANILNAKEEQDIVADTLKDLAIAGGKFAVGLGKSAAADVSKILLRIPAFMRTAGMSVETRNEVGRLLMMTPEELADELDKRPETLKRLSDHIARLQRHGATAGTIGLTTAVAP